MPKMLFPGLQRTGATALCREGFLASRWLKGYHCHCGECSCGRRLNKCKRTVLRLLPAHRWATLVLSLSPEMHPPPGPLPSPSTSTHNFSTDLEESDWSICSTFIFSLSSTLGITLRRLSPPVSQDPVSPVPSYKACSSSDSDEIPYSESSPPRPLFRPK